LLASLGKSAFAFARGARLAGISVVAIADDRFTGWVPDYRGIPVLSLEAALTQPYDAVLIGETAAVHTARVAADLQPYDVHPIQLHQTPARANVAELVPTG
jgi:hypothetical protein